MIGSIAQQLNRLPELGVTRVSIEECSKVGFQCTLSSDGAAPNTTIGNGGTPSDAIQAAINRFVTLHMDEMVKEVS